MKFNESVIPHYSIDRVPMEALKHLVKIAPDHLKEKSSWFNINGELCYFKERDSARMFTEIFEQEYGTILGFDMAKYGLACIKERDIDGRPTTKLGLLSPNYQNKQFNYYLASDLMNSSISNMGSYGPYTLENLIAYFEAEYTGIPGIEKAIQDTINLYIFDYFNGQTDRNPKNLCYEMKVEGGEDAPHYWGLHGKRVVSIRLATVFDSEKSLGLEKTSNGYDLTDDSLVWQTAFPYSQFVNADGFGVDPHIVELFFSHEHLARPLIERLAYENEYLKAIEMFDQSNSRIVLDPTTKKHLLGIFLGRQQELKRLLTL